MVTKNIINMKNKLKTTIGLLLMPLFIALYYNDKIIMLVLPHLEQPPIQKWFRNNKAMSNTLLRIIVFWASIGIYKLIYFLIG